MYNGLGQADDGVRASNEGLSTATANMGHQTSRQTQSMPRLSILYATYTHDFYFRCDRCRLPPYTDQELMWSRTASWRRQFPLSGAGLTAPEIPIRPARCLASVSAQRSTLAGIDSGAVHSDSPSVINQSYPNLSGDEPGRQQATPLIANVNCRQVVWPGHYPLLAARAVSRVPDE